MGCCTSSLTDDQKRSIAESNKLDRMLTSTSTEESKVIKLLLLGTGESGKSTIFKQMQILYQKGFNDFEKSTFRHVVRRNVVESMQVLIGGVEKFRLSWTNPQSAQAADFFYGIRPTRC